MFLSGNKQQTVKIRDQSMDLKETKDLYGWLMVLAKSNRDIDQKSAIGNFEFTLGLPGHCLLQMDPSFHVLKSQSLFTAWKSWRKTTKQIKMQLIRR